jgi:hypothetical protein
MTRTQNWVQAACCAARTEEGALAQIPGLIKVYPWLTPADFRAIQFVDQFSNPEYPWILEYNRNAYQHNING